MKNEQFIEQNILNILSIYKTFYKIILPFKPL